MAIDMDSASVLHLVRLERYEKAIIAQQAIIDALAAQVAMLSEVLGVASLDGKEAASLRLSARDEVVLTAGSAQLILRKDGAVAVRGKDISATGSGKISLKASSDLELKGARITQN